MDAISASVPTSDSCSALLYVEWHASSASRKTGTAVTFVGAILSRSHATIGRTVGVTRHAREVIRATRTAASSASVCQLFQAHPKTYYVRCQPRADRANDRPRDGSTTRSPTDARRSSTEAARATRTTSSPKRFVSDSASGHDISGSAARNCLNNRNVEGNERSGNIDCNYDFN